MSKSSKPSPTNDRSMGAPDPGEPRALNAVLFDMDGVVTDTAEAHAAAWKRLFDEFLRARADEKGEAFHPFDSEDDYRRYVDGKPRYDGVASFLASRGIELPRGHPSDGPDCETVCGLGNRKNGYFLEWLETNRVPTYPSTIAFLERLGAAGVRVAVFSASRNSESVLRNAGVHDLFEARVDGNDLARLDLPGKPDPSMLFEAARRVGSEPHGTAVVEDSLAGVQAGATGGFRPVVGIDRGDYGSTLGDAGANIVVGDVGELALSDDSGLVAKHLSTLPAARGREGELRERLGRQSPAIFLDYDGTLTPIVEDPTAAELSDAMRRTLAGLVERWPVAVISGRDLEDLRWRVGVEGLVYAGSHGFEIAGPGFEYTAQNAQQFLPGLDDAEAALRDRLAGIAGHLVERKRFAIAVHYRRVAGSGVPTVEGVVDSVLAQHPRLVKRHGKKVFQVQPRVDWNKGRAVKWVLRHLGLDGADVAPVYIGDDLTDEDVFRVLAGWGIALAVQDGDRTTAADYALEDPGDVRHFLEALLAEGGLSHE